MFHKEENSLSARLAYKLGSEFFSEVQNTPKKLSAEPTTGTGNEKWRTFEKVYLSAISHFTAKTIRLIVAYETP